MSKNTAVRVSILTIFLSASIFSCALYAKSALFPICGAAVFILLNIFPSFIKRPSKKTPYKFGRRGSADIISRACLHRMYRFSDLRKSCHRMVHRAFPDRSRDNRRRRPDPFLERNYQSISDLGHYRRQMARRGYTLRAYPNRAPVRPYQNYRTCQI